MSFDPFDIVHLVVTLVTGQERWEGNGFWPAPSGEDEWFKLTVDMSVAVMVGVRNLIDLNSYPRIRIEAERYLVRGPFAESIRKKMMGFSANDPANVVWSPIVADLYNLGGGPTNG